MHPFADHFSPLAPAYAAARPTYPDALLSFVAELAPTRDHAWDCAAGSGQATVALARRFSRVTATDASGAQLALAPALANVTYRVAPAEASGLPDASVDLLAVAQALHWLDLDAFFTEAGRVLVPGGVLAAWCYGVQTLGEDLLDRVLRRFYSEVVGPYWPPERRLVETGYRTLTWPFPELPAPAFEMSVRWTLASLLAYVRTWSATAAYVRACGHDPVEALGADLGRVWGQPDTVRTVRWPLSVRIGRTPRVR